MSGPRSLSDARTRPTHVERKVLSFERTSSTFPPTIQLQVKQEEPHTNNSDFDPTPLPGEEPSFNLVEEPFLYMKGTDETPQSPLHLTRPSFRSSPPSLARRTPRRFWSGSPKITILFLRPHCSFPRKDLQRTETTALGEYPVVHEIFRWRNPFVSPGPVESEGRSRGRSSVDSLLCVGSEFSPSKKGLCLGPSSISEPRR